MFLLAVTWWYAISSCWNLFIRIPGTVFGVCLWCCPYSWAQPSPKTLGRKRPRLTMKMTKFSVPVFSPLRRLSCFTHLPGLFVEHLEPIFISLPLAPGRAVWLSPDFFKHGGSIILEHKGQSLLRRPQALPVGQIPEAPPFASAVRSELRR